MRKLIPILFAVALLSPPAPAGADPAFCSSPTHAVTVVSNTGATVPASALARRVTIDVCNSLENAGTPVMKCRMDGTAPVMGTANVGDVLAKGDCVRYRVGSGTSVKCISDTVGAVAHSLECR